MSNKLKMAAFSITFVRHGETKYNKDNIIQGQLDVPLSEKGLQQARLVGVYLKQQKFSHIYSSDLARAKQTVEGIIKQNDCSVSHVVHDARLRERNFGICQGKNFRHLKEAANQANQSIKNFTPPGGETLEQVRKRAISFFQDLCALIFCQEKIPKCNKEVHLSDSCCKSIESECQIRASMISNSNQHESDTEKSVTTSSSDYCKGQLEMNFDLTKEVFDGSGQGTYQIDVCSDKKSDEKFSNIDEIVVKSNDYITSKKEVESNFLINRNFENPCLTSSKEIAKHSDSTFCKESPNTSTLNGENCSSVPFNSKNVQKTSTANEAKVLANVLVISHGGLLRELFLYFVDALNCSIPGGKQLALHISPNTAVSSFTVFSRYEESPKIMCNQIHYKEHLASLTVSVSNNGIEIAL